MKTVEIVLSNFGGELNRVEVQATDNDDINVFSFRNAANRDLVSLLTNLRVGDTLTVTEPEV